MGAIEMLLGRILESRDAKRNPNMQSLQTLQKLYPDQEINDQSILRGIEQEQQRINPSFRMPRETTQGSGVAPTSPFTTRLAPGEDSSVSDAMVNRYLTDSPIRAIRPPSQEMWTLGEDGVPRPTGQSIPKGAMVTKDPRIEMMRQIMLDAAKQETHFGYQSDLEGMRQGRQDDRAIMQERGRNARAGDKQTKVKTHLWHNPETGEMSFVSEDDVNAGKYQGWKPFNYKSGGDEDFINSMRQAAGGGSAPAGQGQTQPTAPGLDKTGARALLKKMGYDVPQ